MYDEKESGYFSTVRIELLNLIPQENRNGTILEIGAASGETLLYAKKHNYAEKIYGIELVDIPDSQQSSNEFEDFVIGNIENIDFPFPDVKFDAIILGDVLEHLIDPYKLVRELTQYLSPNGVVIASIPNIREWKTMKQILFKGDFKYADEGILDRTHLRFFTKKNIIDLFEDNGYTIETIKSNNDKSPMDFLIRLRLIKTFMQAFLPDLLTVQYYVVAKVKV